MELTKWPIRWGETSKETTIVCTLISTKNTKPTKKFKKPECAVIIVQKKQNKNKCILQVSTGTIFSFKKNIQLKAKHFSSIKRLLSKYYLVK